MSIIEAILEAREARISKEVDEFGKEYGTKLAEAWRLATAKPEGANSRAKEQEKQENTPPNYCLLALKITEEPQGKAVMLKSQASR